MSRTPMASLACSRRQLMAGSAARVLTGMAAAWPLASASASASASTPVRWQNWSGLQRATPSALVMPAHERELQAWLKRSTGELRPVGAGHSFSPLVPTAGAIVSLERLSGLVALDREAMTVSVQAGTRLGVLSRLLEAQGLALRNLPDVDMQALAGALATATHGTGATLPAVHADVTALRMLSPAGEVVELSARQDPAAFAAARVGLGCLGLITQVTLRVVPLYSLERRVWLQPVASLLQQAPVLAAKHRHFELFHLPFTGYAAAVAHDLYSGQDLQLPQSPDDEVLLELRRLRDWLGHFPALRTWAAQRLIDPSRTEVARHHAHRLLATVRPVRFNETEWHVPAARGIECLRQVIAKIEQHNEAFFPIEFRYVKADDAWLSPFQGRDSCSIAVHAAADEAHDYLLREVAPICRAHGGRPHWGKLHPLGAAELAPMYPHWQDFQRVRARLDPSGRMLNPHLRSLFGVA